MQQLMAKPELVQAHQEYKQRSKAGEAQAALLDELTKKTLKQLQQKCNKYIPAKASLKA